MAPQRVLMDGWALQAAAHESDAKAAEAKYEAADHEAQVGDKCPNAKGQ